MRRGTHPPRSTSSTHTTRYSLLQIMMYCEHDYLYKMGINYPLQVENLFFFYCLPTVIVLEVLDMYCARI